MKKSLLLLLLLVLPQPALAAKLYRVVVFGDSLTSGYQLQEGDGFAARLENKIRANGYSPVQVINMSVAGQTAAAATANVDKVRQQLPDVVIVQLGFNDAVRGVLPSAIAYTVSQIVSQIRDTGAYVVLVGTYAPPAMGDKYNNELMKGYYQVATDNRVALYPAALEGISNDPAMTLADGLHPNSSGVTKMVDAIFPLVKTGLDWRKQVYESEVEQSKAAHDPTMAVLPPP